MITMQP